MELEYDGLCIPPIPFEINKEALAADINQMILEKTRLEIIFCFKDYDADFVQKSVIELWKEQQVDKNSKPIAVIAAVKTAAAAADDDDDAPIGVFSDLEAAQAIYRLYPHWKHCDKVLFVFNNTNGTWECEETAHHNIFTRFDAELHYLEKRKVGGEIKSVRTKKSYGSNLQMMRAAIPLLKTLCIDNSWCERTSNTSLGKLLFKNGYLDMESEIFYDKFNPDIVFFGNIDHKFIPLTYEVNYETESYIDDIKFRLFTLPLGEEVGDFLLLNLARGLAGNFIKRILFLLGESDAGKSTVVNAISAACGI